MTTRKKMVEPGATSYQKLMIGVFDGGIDTPESVLCIHRAKKVEKDEKIFETHKLLILIEKMTFL